MTTAAPMANLGDLLSDEQWILRDSVRKFVDDKVAPRAQEIDHSNKFADDLYREMGELGLLGVLLPESVGGAGADTVSQGLIQEELARGSATMANAQTGAVEEGLLIFEHATPELRDRYLPGVIAGSSKAAFALTEPSAGSDAAGIKMRATRDGDSWVISGEKSWVTAGAFAGVVIVVAVTDPSQGSKGTSAFLVDRDTPGLSVGREEDLHGVRGLGTCSMSFDDCRVPAKNLVGEEGGGLRLGLTTINLGRISTAGMAVGIAVAALEASLAYVQEREQFGRPISKFQMIRQQLAEMSTQVDAGRLLYIHAAKLRDQGAEYVREASEAKLFCSEMACRVADRAMMIFGASGYVRESPVERLVRDARVTQIFEGASNIQHLVIARQLLDP